MNKTLPEYNSTTSSPFLLSYLQPKGTLVFSNCIFNLNPNALYFHEFLKSEHLFPDRTYLRSCRILGERPAAGQRWAAPRSARQTRWNWRQKKIGHPAAVTYWLLVKPLSCNPCGHPQGARSSAGVGPAPRLTYESSLPRQKARLTHEDGSSRLCRQFFRSKSLNLRLHAPH